MKYYIKTFGCQHNAADSERVAARYKSRGMTPARGYSDADYVCINTCMVRKSAEHRVYGLVENLRKIKAKKPSLKIIVTGCMVGAAFRDPSGNYLKRLKDIMPSVDEFMPIEEVGFDHEPIRMAGKTAWVPISNGCNNFCTFCIVPFTRGREVSRPYEDVINECKDLREKGYTQITLLGQNVNSYGADLVLGKENVQVMRDLPGKDYFSNTVRHSGTQQSEVIESQKRSALQDDTKTYQINGKSLAPIYVKHLGKLRIPTLFPYLLEDVAKLGFKKVDFLSSNPWDFSPELIDVIARNKNVTRTLHLALQSGDDKVLHRMNRWYTSAEYLDLLERIKKKIPQVKFTTDIIVGFCGETDEEFQNTVELAKKANFLKAYIAMYSLRPLTVAGNLIPDDLPHVIKKKRWLILDEIINKPHLKESAGVHTYGKKI